MARTKPFGLFDEVDIVRRNDVSHRISAGETTTTGIRDRSRSIRDDG